MMLLRAYLVKAVLRGVATVLAVLVAVTSVIEFVGQLNDVGTGDYGLQEAVLYVALNIPRTVFATLPIAALIGTLLSLGNLAVHRELIVMRASGVSSWQMLSAVGLAGFVLAVLMVLLGESVAPSLGAYAREMRTRTMHEEIALANGQATWLREGDRIVSLRRQAGDLGYGGGVLLFELGPDQTLTQVARADSADLDAVGGWVLCADVVRRGRRYVTRRARIERGQRRESGFARALRRARGLARYACARSLHRLSRSERLGRTSLSRRVLVACR
jgi:lipopolysaccharide export system permease protein